MRRARTTLTANATFGYNSCKTAHYTTNGSFQATVSYTRTQTTESARVTANGSLNVSTLDGRSGVCLIDVTLNAGASQTGNPVYIVSGTACGAKVTGTY